MALQMIDPENPQVYNGIKINYGILPILNALAVMSRERERKTWTLYLINIETLIRDHRDTTLRPDQLARNIVTDCSVMTQYIAAYNRTVNLSNRHHPVVCFYMSHYENIPQFYRRPKYPKGTEERWVIRDELEKIIAQEGFSNNFDDTEAVFEVAGESRGSWPTRDVITDLEKRYEDLPYRSTLLISHVPLDFHFYRTFKDFMLLESYTGNFKTLPDLGKKVFGDAALPFNKYTHLLLGDKWYLKNQVENKFKKQLIDRASTENWSLLPEKRVWESMVKMGLPIQPDYLVRPDL